MKLGKTVERGTSPLQLSSDEDRKKGDGSYSDTLDQLSTSSQHDKVRYIYSFATSLICCIVTPE